MATAKKTTTTKSTARKTSSPRAATTKSTATAAGAPEVTKTRAPEATKTKEGFAVNFGSIDLSTVDVKALATDYAYATVGYGDRAIEVARELPQRLEVARKQRLDRTTSVVKTNRVRVESLLKEAPEKAQAFVKDVPTKLQSDLSENLETARKEFDGYAARGRKVVDSIAKAPTTKRALSQTENARSQVKGAVTSLRKAVEQSQEALDGAVARLGKRRSA